MPETTKKILFAPSGVPEITKKKFVGLSGVPETTKKIFVGLSGVPETTKKIFDGLSGVPESMKKQHQHDMLSAKCSKTYSNEATLYNNNSSFDMHYCLWATMEL